MELLAVAIIVLMQAFMGCSTGYQVKKIDTEIVVKGQVDNKVLGLNKDNEIVLQEEQDAADELRVQEAVNLHLRDELDREAHGLKMCHKDMADPRLGGSGKLPENMSTDIKTSEEIREEIGINPKGELTVVRKSYFIDKLKIERRYGESLRKMIKTSLRQKEECEFAMGQARRKAGLPSERYQGEGYYHNGAFVQSKTNETNLDDAFEKQAAERRAVQPKQELTPVGYPMVDDYGNKI